MSEAAITLSVQRLLGDRSYEKRKTGAISVEESVRGLKDRLSSADLSAGEKAKLDAQIRDTINQLGEMFCRSPNANHRKGGLIGLAGAAIGLMEKTHEYLPLLLPPVLHCFQDPESRVRYYACESLFNIAKVSRNHVLAWFPKIFSGLCQLYSDVDVDVKNGAQLLDRLVKEIVTESTDFDVEVFIPLLQRKLKLKNPYIRQLLLGWISVFDSIPKINMLSHLPNFLEGLFSMLNDEVREIRLHSDQVLMVFLGEIKEAEVETIAHLLGPMVDILVAQCHQDIDPLKRHTAMTWLHDFIGFGRLRLQPLYAKLLSAVLGGIADEEKEVRDLAKAANGALLDLLEMAYSGGGGGGGGSSAAAPGGTVAKAGEPVIDLSPLLEHLRSALGSPDMHVRVASLTWMSMFLENDAAQMLRSIDELLPLFYGLLRDEHEDVVLKDLEVIALVARDEEQFKSILATLMVHFRDNRTLLEKRGGLIIRNLCLRLSCDSIFSALARDVEQQPDARFASLMVQSLDLILLTAPELAELRALLKGALSPTATPEAREIFTTVYRAWCRNPVSTFSLCLLAQAYELAHALIHKFAEAEITLGLLMQVRLYAGLPFPFFSAIALLSLSLSYINNRSRFLSFFLSFFLSSFYRLTNL